MKEKSQGTGNTLKNLELVPGLEKKCPETKPALFLASYGEVPDFWVPYLFPHPHHVLLSSSHLLEKTREW